MESTHRTREPAIAVCLNNARRPQTKTDLCLPPGRPSSLWSGCPHRASRTCFSFRSLWACRACRTGISPWTLWTCISRQTGLSRSPLSPFGPCGPAGPASPAGPRSPVAPTGPVSPRSPHHPSAPEDPRAPVPLGPGGPTTVGIRFTASFRRYPAFVPLTVRFLLTPGLFCCGRCKLAALLAALSAVFLDNSASAALCDDSLAFERPQKPRTRTYPLTALLRLHFLPPAGLTPMHPLLKCQHLQRSLLL